VNNTWTQLQGEANNVIVQIGQWKDKATFSIAPLNDYNIILGMDFFDYLEPVMVSSKDTMLIMQSEKPCIVSIYRENELSPKHPTRRADVCRHLL
jgi:hypothetical protein